MGETVEEARQQVAAPMFPLKRRIMGSKNLNEAEITSCETIEKRQVGSAECSGTLTGWMDGVASAPLCTSGEEEGTGAEIEWRLRSGTAVASAEI